MKPILVLAASLVSYRNFIKQFNLNANEVRFVRDGDIDEVRGYGFDTPVILLEEYMYNRAYSLRLMNYIGHRFNNIGILTDRERFFYD